MMDTSKERESSLGLNDIEAEISAEIETSHLLDEATGRKTIFSDQEEDGISEHSEENFADIYQDRKQSQMASTLQWLSENYERAEGVCLPRCVLYSHYLDFCKKRVFTPSGAATFGKVLRQKFPKLTTRRLGTRGQSKYHYYGIGIKETSVYYHSVYRGKGLTRFSGAKVKSEAGAGGRKYSLSSKAGTLLPDFPEARLLELPDGLPREKVGTFLMMYRTHCQRVLDTVISANFDEVQNFFLHFWQGMPDHLVPLLSRDVIVDLIGLCDAILYKVLNDVLIPSSIQDIPDSLNEEIRQFTRNLSEWLEISLDEVPEKIKHTKMKVVFSFIRNLRRQMTFVHLAQAAKNVLMSHENVSQMAADLAELDFQTIFVDMTLGRSLGEPARITSEEESLWWKYISEFENLLNKQAPVESYTEWLDNVVDASVLQPAKQTTSETTSASSSNLERFSRDFLLQWSFVTAKIMRNLTLESAAGFGSFHLIYMMFNEYVFLVVETQQALVLETQLQENVRKYCTKSVDAATTVKRKADSKDVTTSSGNRECEKTRPSCTTVPGKQGLERERNLLEQDGVGKPPPFLQSPYQSPPAELQVAASHHFGSAGTNARFFPDNPFPSSLKNLANVYEQQQQQQAPPAYYSMAAAQAGYHGVGYPELGPGPPYSPSIYLPADGAATAAAMAFGHQFESTANRRWAAAPNYVDPYAATTAAYRINGGGQAGFNQSQQGHGHGYGNTLLTPHGYLHHHQYNLLQPNAAAPPQAELGDPAYHSSHDMAAAHFGSAQEHFIAN